MPRGSRPGERRGGRKRGTPNKKTVLKNALFLAAAANPNGSPLEFMLALMRDPQVSVELRLDAAVLAAPFVHVRPRPIAKKRLDPVDTHDQPGEGGELKYGKLEPKTDSVEEGGTDAGLSPLDFLVKLMADPDATPQQRLKAAAVAARYRHAVPTAEAEATQTLIVVEDQFGFKVDPELARAERDDRLRENQLRQFNEHSAEGMAAKPKLERIAKRREERVAAVTFPDGYTYLDRRRDQKRLGQLWARRLSRKRLTLEEEAEEAHLAVRTLNPASFEKEVIIFDWRDLGNGELLRRTAILLQRKRDGIPLTAAEEEEVLTFQRRYPNCSAKLRDGKGFLTVRARVD